jgi:hypothetical protein
MLGSLGKVWPWKDEAINSFQNHVAEKQTNLVNVFPDQMNEEVTTAFSLMALGIGIVLLMDRLGRALSRQ